MSKTLEPDLEQFRGLPEEVQEYVEDPARYGRPKWAGYRPDRVLLSRNGISWNWPDSVEEITIDDSRGTARYRTVDPEQYFEIIVAEPGLETALIYDHIESQVREESDSGFDNMWLYHDGSTWYRETRETDLYFIPACRPEITESWSTVKDSLHGEI